MRTALWMTVISLGFYGHIFILHKWISNLHRSLWRVTGVGDFWLKSCGISEGSFRDLSESFVGASEGGSKCFNVQWGSQRELQEGSDGCFGISEEFD